MSLILVAGGRRTGTTLVTGILCADEDANPVIGETPMLRMLVQALQWARRPQNFESFVKYSFAGEEDLVGFFTRIVDEYVSRTRAMQGNPKHVVLKNPEFCTVMEDLLLAAPEARVVVTVRDPRDQITSDLEVQNKDDAGHVVGDGRTYRDIAAAAKTLNGYYARVAAAERISPDRILYVRYEDIPLKFNETLAVLQAFTGLSRNTFDPRHDWPRYAAVSDLEGGYADLTPFYGRPLEASRIGRYKTYLEPKEVLQVERDCRKLMRRFGYELSQTASG